MYQPTRQPAQSFDDPVIHSFGYACAQQNFAEQNKHWHCNKQEIRAGLPRHIGHGAIKWHRTVEMLQN